MFAIGEVDDGRMDGAITAVVGGGGWLDAGAATLVVAAPARPGPAGSSAAAQAPASITNPVATISSAR